MSVVDRVSVLSAARAVGVGVGRRRPGSPAELARRILPGYRVTPTLSAISDALGEAIREPDRRVIISTPPRTGKSVLTSQIGPLFALSENPDAKVIIASYADTLAQEHSHAARALVAEHSGLLGFKLRADKTAVGRWRVDGHAGGLLAGGILSGITGFGADLLLLDDVLKNAQEADSVAYRRRILNEFRSTLMTRLHPGGSVVLIGTRWHPEDLIGTLLEEEPDRWSHINVPAVAEFGVPDVLGRVSGSAMVSALGRSAGQFADIRRSVGERSWYALFQGVPAAPEGGLVKREWLESWRLPAAPQLPVLTVVGVDPSDSGSGDSCGLVAASLMSDGVVAVVADQSAPMTSDQWARAAVDLAVGVGASEIVVESFAARATYERVVREALSRVRVGRPVRVSGWPPKGSGRGQGDAVARSAALLQGLETGMVRVAGHLPGFEDAACGWQVGQHQPDSLAALVVAHDVLVHAAGARVSFGVPLAGSVVGGSRGPAAGGGVTSLSGWLSRRVAR